MILADPQPFNESKPTNPNAALSEATAARKFPVDKNGNHDSGWDGAVFSRARSASSISKTPDPRLKSGLVGRFLSPSFSRGLDAFDVLPLPAFGALHYVELHLLTSLEAAKPGCLDGGEMHEHIFAILAADKTIALGIVKPLYGSCFHDVALSLLG